MKVINFIDALTRFMEFNAILVITYKMEQQEVNKKILMKGLLLSILMLFFSYFIRYTMSRVFPLIATFSAILYSTLFIFTLFNQYYRNNFVRSVLKTGITILIIVICQTILIPFIPIVSSVLGYELMIEIMSFFAQFWIIAFMFFIYPRFRNRVNQMILEFSDYPNYVLGGYLYFIIYVIVVTYLSNYLIDNVFALITMVLMSMIIFVGFIYTVYKYFIKVDENKVAKKMTIDAIE